MGMRLRSLAAILLIGLMASTAVAKDDSMGGLLHIKKKQKSHKKAYSTDLLENKDITLDNSKINPFFVANTQHISIAKEHLKQWKKLQKERRKLQSQNLKNQAQKITIKKLKENGKKSEKCDILEDSLQQVFHGYVLEI